MDANYPIMVRLDGKIVVVVGGGRVAERKISSLLDTGARVVVISPSATDEIQRLSLEGTILWKQKAIAAEDLQEAFLIFAATADKEVNQWVKSLAGEHQLVTIADDPEGSDFHVPAHFKRGRLSMAVSTGGASPTLARKIREQLEGQFDEKYEAYLDFLSATRNWILKEVEDPSLKKKLLTVIVSDAFLNSSTRVTDFQRIYDEMK
ncbi:NAD(P)-binding protein [Neobacillus jeddahensis]|uniref:NAD(P)-binding protein n=1 Tax=Neobacillus jeddahensis TaxID=1461580 RepID=UPI00058B0CD5|nr:NAD(P)-binding protein [Neobacillus jeddahensis]